jgi:hypothetical protein
VIFAAPPRSLYPSLVMVGGMRRRGRFRIAGVLLVGACSLAVLEAPARADEPPSADRLKSAAEEYDRGRRAFLADDFEGASVHFENAYRDAPRAETLRLAIRARRKAKQNARAATLAAIAAERYPNDPATAQIAKETLDEAAPQLQELLIECASECAVTADGRVASQTDGAKHRLFLEPGSHELGISFKLGGSAARHVDAKKGARDALTFEAPVVAKPVEDRAAPPTPVTAAPTSEKPLPPVVFYVAAGVTVALAGVTVYSGLDAKNHPGVDAVRRACAGKDTSCPEYQDGKSAETRTNVLLGVTLGAAALTAVTGIFLTRWSSSPVKVGAAPLPGGGTIGAVGSF